jgi:hypothetical protein
MLVTVSEMWTIKKCWLLRMAIRPSARVELHLAPTLLELKNGVSCTNEMQPNYLQPVQGLQPGTAKVICKFVAGYGIKSGRK